MNIPFTDMIKSIPGVFGIRLEEELPYTEIRMVGQVELRRYEPFTLARVRGRGEFEDASDENFRTLADFIFGNNSEYKQTAMTTPVFHDRDGDEWIMSFYIPESENHLVPTDPSIEIEHMPAKTVAVYRYKGNSDLLKMAEARDILLSELGSHGIKPASEVWWAQYDQPFSVPLLKRNEALVRIEE